MRFIDKMEKMEQQMWKSAGKKAEKKAKEAKKVISPKNYKRGVFGQVACLLMAAVYVALVLFRGFFHLCGRVGDMIYDPAFAGREGNIFHED